MDFIKWLVSSTFVFVSGLFGVQAPLQEIPSNDIQGTSVIEQPLVTADTAPEKKTEDVRVKPIVPEQTPGDVAKKNTVNAEVYVLYLNRFNASPNTGDLKLDADAVNRKEQPVISRKVFGTFQINASDKYTSGSIDWGDGTVERLAPALKQQEVGKWKASAYAAEHKYARAGGYTITVTPDGGESKSLKIQVFEGSPALSIVAPTSGSLPSLKIGSQLSIQWVAENIPSNYRFAISHGGKLYESGLPNTRRMLVTNLPSSARTYTFTIPAGIYENGALIWPYKNGTEFTLHIHAYPDGEDPERLAANSGNINASPADVVIGTIASQ